MGMLGKNTWLYRRNKGIHGNSGGYMGMKRNKGEYTAIQGNAEEYMGIQGNYVSNRGGD